MPASNSEDNRDPDQDTDSPLPTQEDANVAQPEDTAEDYVSWLGDDRNVGVIPKLMIPFLGFVSALTAGYLVTGAFLGEALGLKRHINLPLYEVTQFLALAYLVHILQSFWNWSPLLVVYLVLRSQSNKITSRIVIVIGACVFGLFSWVYCTLVSIRMDEDIALSFRTWYGGSMPLSFRGCYARVRPNQASLFEPDIYSAQFARTMLNFTNSSDYSFEPSYYNHTFDIERFRSIQVNLTLCNQGFEGNPDLYGLGIRTSLYLQWHSSFLANNFLSGSRQELQKAYLYFTLAICLATIITSFKSCTFSIEIEIMYWMYWGGYVCVFASAPCQVRLGSKTKWIKLDWTTTVLFTTHVLMIYHGLWFDLYAYDQVFSRMPCGTYHFFLFPILDPSEGFWTLRDYLNHLLVPFITPLVVIFPFVGLLLASEVRYTVQHSAAYQTLFPKPTVSDRDQHQTTVHNASVKASPGLRAYLFIIRWYRGLRGILGFPSHSRGGIRLVTPVDVRDRRFVAFIDRNIFPEC